MTLFGRRINYIIIFSFQGIYVTHLYSPKDLAVQSLLVQEL